MGIYKRKQESNKTRKHAFDQEKKKGSKHALDQENGYEKKEKKTVMKKRKKTRSRLR